MAHYSESQKAASMKYNREHIKRVPLDVPKEFYEEVLKPVADQNDLPVNTFVKQTIQSALDDIAPDAAFRIYKKDGAKTEGRS